MNKIHITAIAMLAMLPNSAYAQDTSQNYVKTETMLDASGTNSVKAVQYYNGLGYPTVSVTTTGGNGETAYLLTTYDALGREACKYLPVPDANKSIMFKSPDDIIGLSSKENNNDNTAYSRHNYDALNRVTSVELPGKAWRDDNRRNISEYSTNAEKEVSHYMANPNGKFSLVKPNDNKSNPYQYYPAGSLIKEVSIDADNKKSETYKDLFGNIILQRMYDGNTKLDTYYVYDDLNRLCYVLSPQYQKTGTKAINCYEYRYDSRGRIVKKILPGCSYIQYWYDNADRLICMQDGVMRENHKYRFYMYDNLGRMVIQGLYPYWNYNSTFFKSNSAITTFNKESDGFCGTGYVVPSKFIEDPTKAILEIVNYYDGNQTLIKNKEFAKNFNNLSLNSTVCQIGQLTGNVTLAGSMEAGNAEYLAQAMEYDLRGNLTIAKSRLFGGKIVSSKNTYTYTNQLSIACDTIDVGYGKKLITYNSKGYNVNNNKMSSHYISICHGSNIFTANLKYYYDALGRLSTVTRPFTSDVNCNINYSYDIHGWLKKITTNSFTEELFYADGEGTKYYNGNISSVKWKDNSKSISNLIRGYRYSYDDVNRMTSGIYGEGTKLSSNLDKYSEYVSYDPNGNIIKLTRHGRYSTSGSGYGIMDGLTISYNGNQPLSVSETSADSDFSSSFEYKRSNGTGYKFNANGSLYADKSRCIAYIKYDYNNNPTMIYFTNGNTTEYIYSAAGQKLRAIHNTCKPNVLTRKFGEEATGKLPPKYILQTDTIQYLLGGAIVMINGRIDKYLFEGGYAQATPKDSDNDTFAYYYYNQDHLGNNREVVDASGVVKQVTNYFPFGATYADRNAEKGTNIQEYKYNGKELDRMHGLNTYDYGARQYNPVTARWDRMDPHSEDYYDVSPYVYCHNNPVMMIDPDGQDDYILNQNGTLSLWRETKDEKDCIYSQNRQNCITVNQSITRGLTTKRKDYNGHYAEYSGVKEMVDLFYFVANNTNVEWSFHGYHTKKGDNYLLATSHSVNSVSWTNGSNDEYNLTFAIHTHPGDDPQYASGFNTTEIIKDELMVKPSCKFQDNPYGDRGTVWNVYGRIQARDIKNKKVRSKYPPFYIYHIKSQNRIKYDPFNRSIVKKRIRKPSDLIW